MTIVKDSLQEQIQNVIKQRIISKVYKPGQQINTKEIAEEHEISIMPVRDALHELTTRKLVHNRERVGFFVRAFSKSEAMDILAVRRMYELHCLDTWFDDLDRVELKRICNTFTGQDKKFKHDLMSVEFKIQLDYEMHKHFIYASKNDFLIKSYEEMLDLFVLFSHKDTTRDEAAGREHRVIIENILQYNKEAAINALSNHLDLVKKEIVNAIASEETTYA